MGARTPAKSSTPAQLRLAAAVCVERHGVEKTTVEDIAREAGLSRGVVYRHYRSREHLLMDVLHERSNALREQAVRYMALQPSFRDALVEGLLYLAQHGRRDPFMRRLVEAEGALYAQRLLRTSGAGARAAGEFWGPVLDRAESAGELAPDLDRAASYAWLADVGLLLMAHLLVEPDGVEPLRHRLRSFVWPAFAAGTVQSVDRSLATTTT